MAIDSCRSKCTKGAAKEIAPVNLGLILSLKLFVARRLKFKTLNYHLDEGMRHCQPMITVM